MCERSSSSEENSLPFNGQIRDVDTHEMFPARLWVKEFGDFVAPVAKHFIETQPEDMPNSVSVSLVDDDAVIDSDTIQDHWAKGCLAPGAYDMSRRLEVMDAAGIDDSLVFGTILGVIGFQFATCGGGRVEQNYGGQIEFDAIEAGYAMVKAHNDWCVRVAAQSDRLRPVAVLLMDSVEQAMQEAQELIDKGIRGVSIPAGQPFGDRAPSHPDNDPFWQLLADNDVAALLHIGTHFALINHQEAWVNSPFFSINKELPSELRTDPFSLATCSLAPQNYLTNLVLGGVFERVPNLRFGVMEFGAFWLGPVVDNMDMWYDYFQRRYKGVLNLKPSEYIQRNVRVTPFTFEPVDEFILKYPYLEDVLCFSSDYPHHEGGKSPIRDLMDRTAPLGPAVQEKFFVSNAELVMPR